MINLSFIGPSFNTNNLGVNALALGTLQSFVEQDEDIDIVLIDYNKQHEIFYDVTLLDKPYRFRQLNMRFSKQIFGKYHIIRLLFTVLFMKMIPVKSVKQKIFSMNTILKQLHQSRVICSIAGGDSFSDIYGLKRFAYIVLPQILVILMGKPLVLLPQTLGPFKSRFSKRVSRYILRKAAIIYSRDQQGLIAMQHRFGSEGQLRKARFCYDVGFAIRAHPVRNEEKEALAAFKDQSGLIGFNISGLLYIGGYTKRNMFGLRENYQHLVQRIITFLIHEIKTRVVLIPHVLGIGRNLESDQSAIKIIYEEMSGTFPDDIILLKHTYDQNQIKDIINLCDLFIGSRMHACIGAASQSVPPVSLAYSKKFIGVMQSVGLGELVADLRILTIGKVLEIVGSAFENREEYRNALNRTIPDVRAYIRNEFKNILSV